MTDPRRGSELLVQIAGTFGEKGWSLAVAESCTGGLVSGRLTDLPGSSLFMKGALVVYANEAKVDMLGVDEAALRAWGAVSGQVASQMAEGVARAFRADIGLAVTGIAGPGGGTATRPVGTVWFAVSRRDGVRTAKARFPGDRGAVRDAAAWHALGLLLADPSPVRSGAPQGEPGAPDQGN